MIHVHDNKSTKRKWNPDLTCDIGKKESGYTKCDNGHIVRWNIENGYSCSKCGDSAC